jgi:hypothetical protein
MLSLLNEDTLRNLAEFLQPMDLFQTSKIGSKILEWRFPTSIILKGIEQIRQFERYCQMYDTNRLVKVVMVTSIIYDNTDDVFGWVPPSVKTLTIYNNADCNLILYEGIETLTISRCMLYDIIIPNSVLVLTLDDKFNGTVIFPPNLHKLTVLNWSWHDPQQEQDIYTRIYHNIPDSIQEMYIGSNMPLTFLKWSENLIKLTIEKGMYHFTDFPDVPDYVDYTEIIEDDFWVNYDENIEDE